MIIKQLKRKSNSFAQLVTYLNKGKSKDDEYFFRHNIYSDKAYYIIKEFLENAKILKERKNGNRLYHEILSLKKQEGLSTKELKEILQEGLEYYISLRGQNCLVYGVFHETASQVHIHTVFSSNELGENKPHYFSDKEFENNIKKTQEYIFEKYPTLERFKTTNEKDKKKKRAKTKSIDNEIQFKKRTGKQSEREKFRERLKTILSLSKNPNEFNKYLRVENIEIYARGNTFGFLDRTTARKYRLKTLELENKFEKMNYDFKAQAKNNKSFDDEPHINKSNDNDKKKSNFKERLHKVREKKKEKNKDFEKER